MNLLDDLLKRKRLEINLLRSKCSNPVYPNRDEINRLWNLYSKARPPGVDLVLYDAKECIIRRSTEEKFYNLYTYPQEYIHPNHRITKEIQDILVEVLFNEFYSINVKECKVYCDTLYGLVLDDRQFLRYQVISQPISFDSQNRPIEYLKWYVANGIYRGTLLQSTFKVVNDYNQSNRMNFDLRKKNNELFEALGFTKAQLRILYHYKDGLNANQISLLLSISRRTIDKHNQLILSISKRLFPLNQFGSVYDVVYALRTADML